MFFIQEMCAHLVTMKPERPKAFLEKLLTEPANGTPSGEFGTQEDAEEYMKDKNIGKLLEVRIIRAQILVLNENIRARSSSFF